MQQMVIGATVGVIGGRGLLVFIRRVPLPSEGLYPLRTLTSSLMLYGVATLAHGSGFGAVFVAGIVIGDARAPYKGMSNGSTPRWPGWLKSWPSPFSA